MLKRGLYQTIVYGCGIVPMALHAQYDDDTQTKIDAVTIVAKIFKNAFQKLVLSGMTLESMVEIIDYDFAISEIGCFCLGSYRRLFSSEALSQYQETFKRYFASYYFQIFSDIKNMSMQIRNCLKNEIGQYVVHAQCFVERQDGEENVIDILWFLEYQPYAQRLQIVDISIFGYSIAVSKRDEYISILRQLEEQCEEDIASPTAFSSHVVPKFLQHMKSVIDKHIENGTVHIVE